MIDRLRVTSGALEVGIGHPSTRAVLPNSAGKSAILTFRYLGPCDERAQLASGEERHQVGIKLLAEDGENVIYACWRWQPSEPRVWVTAKVAGEYRGVDVTYLDAGVTTPPTVGAMYSLAARIDGRVVQVWRSGMIAWVGLVCSDATRLRGPIGLRTDNARLGAVVLEEGEL